MIVVDSNVLAYLLLPSDFTPAAEALLRSEPDWAAPPLWRSEFRNLLSGYLRRGTLTFEKVVAVQSEAEELLANGEYPVDSPAVLQLVRESRCSAYDCEFVALAIKLNTIVVTLDKQILSEFAKRAVSLGKFGAQ